MNKLLTFALLFGSVGFLFDGRPVEAQVFSLDAATAPANGVTPDDLFPAPGAGPPPFIILPGGAAILAPPADVDALSFGTVFPGSHTVVGANFSVAPGTIGVAGTAVFGESAGAGFMDEAADIFGSGLGGANFQIFDGNGVPAPGFAPPMGVLEPFGPPPVGVSNTDAWDAGPLPPPGAAIHYSVTPFDTLGHPSYLGFSPADIFVAPVAPGYSTPALPAIYAGFGALGLLAGAGGVPVDDIDALAIIEDGLPGFTAGDTIYFSLTPVSPTLGILGASPADILVTTLAGIPAIAFPAATLGLLGIAVAPDDIDALHLFVVPEPSTLLLGLVGLFSLGWLGWRRRRGA